MTVGTQRTGVTALVLVITLLGFAFAGAAAQFGAARHLSSQTASGLAGAQALRTAQNLLDGAADALARAAGDPAHPHFAELRRRLVTAKVARVDLSDLVPAGPVTGALSWKRAHHPAAQPVGTVTAEPVRATALDVRPLPEKIDGTGAVEDERTGWIELVAHVNVTLAGATVTRTLTERREFKLVVAGPPRPFDQTALVLEDLAAVTDAEKANRERTKLLAMLDDTIAKVQSVSASLEPHVAKELADIQKSAPRPDQRDRLMPKLPAGRAGAVGLSQAGGVGLAWLDLGSRLEEDVRELSALHTAMVSAADRAAQDGGKELLERVIASLSVYNRASTRIWEYQRILKIWPASSQDYKTVFEYYGPRLSAAWYAPRAVASLDGELMAAWTSGRRALQGVFELRSAQPVRLEGARAGRTVLVVDAPSVELANLTAARPGDLITVVVTRGRVRVTGRADAYLIADAQVAVEMSADAVLHGGLALRSSGGHALRGRVQWTPGTPTGRTAAEALARAVSPYALALSPVPLLTEGVRQ